MTTIHITALDLLAAVSIAQSDDKTRPYLHGIYFEPLGDTLRMTATNGYVLTCAQAPRAESTDLDAPLIVSVPRVMRAKLRKAKSATWRDGVWTVDDVHLFSAPAIDATFPDYRQVVPAGDADAPIPTSWGAPILDTLTATAAALGHREPLTLTFVAGGTPLVRYGARSDVFSAAASCRPFGDLPLLFEV